MTRNGSNGIEELLRRGDWAKARRLLERERAADPDNHWLLTQIGVTLYEQRRYQDALETLSASRRLLPSCPLTLWHLAGAMDALGKHAAAARIYRQLLNSTASAAEDPCWESPKWTERLKTDCVYRLGACLEHQGKKRAAERCYRQYLDLLLLGIEGLYSVNDVTERIRNLPRGGNRSGAERALRKASATR
jgi:tetratricopeptide (TPR) repeat protein